MINAKIYTVDSRNPWAEAIAIGNKGKILAVGSEKEVSQYISPHTEIIDLKGRMVLPGFEDAHLHAVEAGMNENICVFPEEASFVTYKNYIQECANSWKGHEWVLGAGVYLPALLGREKLPIDLLDELVPDKPVLILDNLGHGAWANSKALALVGYDILEEQPQGGIIHKDKTQNRLTGLVFENAMQRLRDQAWDTNDKEQKITEEGLKKALKTLVKKGVTSISDAGGYWTRGHDKVWKKLLRTNQLTVRSSNALYVYPDRDFKEQLEDLRKRYSNNSHSKLRFNQAKIYVDGILSLGTSALYKPYDKKPVAFIENPEGFLYFTPEILNLYVLELDKIGFQIHFHATGDRAVGLALDAIERAQKINKSYGRHHRITHLYQVSDKDMLRFEGLDVIADFQLATNAISQGYEQFLENYIGNRAKRVLPVRSLLQHHAVTVLSSDWDAQPLSPFTTLQNAVLREFEGVQDIETAIRMMTLNPAILLHQEKDTGSLETGKQADLIVIDRDIFELPLSEIHKTQVILTMINGEIAYDPQNLIPGYR